MSLQLFRALGVFSMTILQHAELAVGLFKPQEAPTTEL